VGALDAFMSTWSNARSTLGEGIPQDGAQFNKSSQLRQAQSGVESAAPGSRWTGSAADAYADANSNQGRVLGQMAGLDQRLGAEVDRSAAVVAAGRQNLDQVKQWVLDAAASVPQGADREQTLMPIARKGIGDVADVVKQTNSDLDAIGARIRALGNEYKVLGGDKKDGKDPKDKDPKSEDPKSEDPKIPPKGADPKEVKKWWDSLSDEQRRQLPKQYPDQLGGLNGIPVEARSEANKTLMQRDLDRVNKAAAQNRVPVQEVTAHPEKYGLSPTDIARYTNAEQVKKGLDFNEKGPYGNEHNPVFLQIYDPEAYGGQGRAAIAIGNPDNAPNTSVLVPGTGNSVRDGWLSGPDGLNVYHEANLADRGKPTSVVMWMGYDAPNSLHDPQVAQTGHAQEGGARLASDVNALESTHQGASHVTVIGHSYGSTTVADAAAGFGMHANDVALVGCPGTDMAKNASDFHLLPGGQVYVGGASTDPVSYLGGLQQAHIPGTAITGGLGADPYIDGFGSTRFKAEVPGWTAPWSDHSHYFTPRSESLFSIADIASGHGDALEHDGMTAPHRVPFPSGVHIPGTPIDIPLPVPGAPFPYPDFDPEAARPGTGGHTH
jgi:hypothetical protein